MQVIQVKAFGGPEVLAPAEVPDPVPGDGAVVVDVAAADTLFVETAIRAGRAREWFPIEPPYVPGNGVAGVVTAVGDGVDAGLPGRRVAAHTGGHGGYASRATAPVDALVEIPEAVSVETAAALLHDGVTAFGLFDAVPVRHGDRVLVVAAAGGLGLLLVQLALAAGAHVVGAARGREKLDLVAAQGAEVVDYTLPGWTDTVLDLGGGRAPDVVFDGAGGDLGTAAYGIVAAGGRFSAHGAASGSFTAVDPEEATRRHVTVTGIEAAQHEPAEVVALTARALSAAADGHLSPVVGRTFPLAEAADAHAAIEARAVPGKTLLVP